MSKRRLTRDEIDLWRKVTDSAQRLHPEKKIHDLPLPKPKPVKQPRATIPEFKLGGKSATRLPAHDLLASVSERVAKQPLQMDKKKFAKLKRGKLVPEGKIDLHGMTMDQAHPALTRFLMRAHGEGNRLVLVITGKGKSKPYEGPIPTRRGVLKHQVPQWLSLPPLRSVVLQVSESHLKHGGGGAYYVYLRR
ncbi:Smr/MutS family protein [Shimia abyssi]|uniref:DNA-nicking Smr family endonuclease n=1 Tax=Shimia abyssi TaxID=1662395 RepID=A0A2P8F8A0_9RHOB|nr:Smr/MutS family protein [Shimia abyssi]PSL17951.1 DNA-nicking Smr family endonuclease [Shimia abyssi]